MKAKLILVCTIAAMSLSIFACSPAQEQSPEQTVVCKVAHVDVSYSGEGKSLKVYADGPSLAVPLYSHPSSGVEWELIEISDRTVLEEAGHQFEPFEERAGCSKVVGSPGIETWTFKALDEGESTITMEYRNIRGDDKPLETLVLTVVTK